MAKRIEKEETFHSGGGCYTSMGKLTNGEWFIGDMTYCEAIYIYKDEDTINRMLDGDFEESDIIRIITPESDEAQELWAEIFQIEEDGIRDGSRVEYYYMASDPLRFLEQCKECYAEYLKEQEDDDEDE